MSRLKELLAERRKAKEQPVAVATAEVQGESDNDTPALVLVPFFDLIQTDEFSEFF